MCTASTSRYCPRLQTQFGSDDSRIPSLFLLQTTATKLLENPLSRLDFQIGISSNKLIRLKALDSKLFWKWNFLRKW